MISHILAEFHPQRATYTSCIITSLKWLIQICSNFYFSVCKIAFYSPNSHCCLGETSPLRSAASFLLGGGGGAVASCPNIFLKHLMMT